MIVNNNKQSVRKLAEGIRGRERVLSTAKGRGNRWWENMGEKNVVVWHCDDVFAATSKCMDGVCGKCYVHHMDSGHSCGVCGENLSSYKNEELERMLKRKRDN